MISYEVTVNFQKIGDFEFNSEFNSNDFIKIKSFPLDSTQCTSISAVWRSIVPSCLRIYKQTRLTNMVKAGKTTPKDKKPPKFVSKLVGQILTSLISDKLKSVKKNPKTVTIKYYICYILLLICADMTHLGAKMVGQIES